MNLSEQGVIWKRERIDSYLLIRRATPEPVPKGTQRASLVDERPTAEGSGQPRTCGCCDPLGRVGIAALCSGRRLGAVHKDRSTTPVVAIHNALTGTKVEADHDLVVGLGRSDSGRATNTRNCEVHDEVPTVGIESLRRGPWRKRLRGAPPSLTSG